MTTAVSSEFRTKYQYLRLGEEEILAYRDSGGEGPVLLFLHDFASFSGSWNELLHYLPEGFRCIRVDLNGFGFSLPGPGEVVSNFDQAELLRKFILKLDLRRLTLIGQGLGGEIALLLALSPEVLARMDRMILLSCSSLLKEIPEYIGKIASIATGRVLRFARSRFLAKLLLDYAYCDPARISPRMLEAYTGMLAHPGRLDSIIRAAKKYKAPDRESVMEGLRRFELPVLLIWGEKDSIVPQEDMRVFSRILRNSTEIRIPDCGHLPQEEFPELTAGLIADFLRRRRPHLPEQRSPADSPSAVRQEVPGRKMRLASLFERWSAGAVVLILILKILQCFRRLGVRAEAHGWRKVTSIFLRGEYSKFMLASFRLNYAGERVSGSLPEAERALTEHLYEFLLTRPELHWSVEPGVLSFRRRRTTLCDIVVAEADATGRLVGLHPVFDLRNPGRIPFSEEQRTAALEQMIRICNQFRDAPDKKRPQLIRQALHRWSKQAKGFSFLSRRNLHRLVERVMSASFLYVSVLPEEPASRERERMRTPDLRTRRHPGWGMSCISARFTADFREVDLWFQFHHITADGAPMQEMLTELKRSWGAAGEVRYPPLHGPVALAETMDCGDQIFRTRLYLDFTRILRLRKWLNSRYLARMNGTASLAGLLMWGLSRHEAFHDKKMLLPVDAGISAQGERELGLLFIRPGFYSSEESPLEEFLNFQKEMNLRMNDIRLGRGESHEFLSLCTMLHPFFYHLASVLAPHDLHEIVGTMGLSVIRDAEMFISPLTDFQSNGFLSLGSVKIRTENGRYAGSLCICGHRRQIRSYLLAIRRFVFHFPELMALPEDWEREL